MSIQNKISGNSTVNFYIKDKNKHLNKYGCQNYLFYIEFIFTKSNNDFKLASFVFEKYFLNNVCKRDLSIRIEVIRISKLYLENPNSEKA